MKEENRIHKVPNVHCASIPKEWMVETSASTRTTITSRCHGSVSSLNIIINRQPIKYQSPHKKRNFRRDPRFQNLRLVLNITFKNILDKILNT